VQKAAVAQMPFLAEAQRAQEVSGAFVSRIHDGCDAVDCESREGVLQQRMSGLSCITLALMGAGEVKPISARRGSAG
jgi:hypothetical protein